MRAYGTTKRNQEDRARKDDAPRLGYHRPKSPADRAIKKAERQRACKDCRIEVGT